MKTVQADVLTDKQIDDIYVLFEHGESSSSYDGVDIKETFTKTMGRFVDYDVDGDVFINYY